jgi:hypothetical protein
LHPRGARRSAIPWLLKERHWHDEAELRARAVALCSLVIAASRDGSYLLWKMGIGTRGKILSGHRASAVGPIQILPFRIAADVPTVDDLWKRHGLTSRMALFPHALHREVVTSGEHEAVARFSVH